MATLWIREYRQQGRTPLDANYPVSGAIAAPVPQEPGIDQSTMTISGTSTQSAEFGADTSMICITADSDFHYRIDDDPTATAGSLPLPSNTPFFVGVTPGQKLAAIVRG